MKYWNYFFLTILRKRLWVLLVIRHLFSYSISFKLIISILQKLGSGNQFEGWRHTWLKRFLFTVISSFTVNRIYQFVIDLSSPPGKTWKAGHFPPSHSHPRQTDMSSDQGHVLVSVSELCVLPVNVGSSCHEPRKRNYQSSNSLAKMTGTTNYTTGEASFNWNTEFDLIPLVPWQTWRIWWSIVELERAGNNLTKWWSRRLRG